MERRNSTAPPRRALPAAPSPSTKRRESSSKTGSSSRRSESGASSKLDERAPPRGARPPMASPPSRNRGSSGSSRSSPRPVPSPRPSSGSRGSSSGGGPPRRAIPKGPPSRSSSVSGPSSRARSTAKVSSPGSSSVRMLARNFREGLQLRVDTGGGDGVAPGTQRRVKSGDERGGAASAARGASSKVGEALEAATASAAASAAAAPAPVSGLKRFKPKFKLDIGNDSRGRTPRLDEGEAPRGGAPNVKAKTPTRSPMSESGAIRFSGFQVRQEGIRRDDERLSGKAAGGETMRDGLIQFELLGKGASGTVYKFLHVPTFKLVAVKMIPVFAKLKRQQMIDEVKALYKHLVPIDADAASAGRGARRMGGDGTETTHAPSPFIVSFFDAYHDLKTGHVHLVVELMDGGSLQDIVDTGGCPDEDVLANISVRVLKGLEFLHEKRQIHRDIKPSNLLINHRGDVKISDFGIVRDLDHTTDQAQTFVGTLMYMSPERIAGGKYGYESDIWSMGLSIMTCALGRFPIDCKSGYWGLLQALRDAPVPELPAEKGYSDEFQDFLRLTLEKDPAKRSSATALLAHPFVRDCDLTPPEIDYDEIDDDDGSQTARTELDDLAEKLAHYFCARGESAPLESAAKMKSLGDQLGMPHHAVRHRLARAMRDAERSAGRAASSK